MGKIIDAEFGGRNANDRYCAACEERYPRSSTLCPRCGGALMLWATHAATDQRKQRRGKLVGSILGLLAAALLVALTLMLR